MNVFILFTFFRFLSFIYRIDLESLFILFLFTSVYFILKYNENPSLRNVFLFYVFFSFAFMVRGPLHFFLIPSIFLYAFVYKTHNLLKILFNPLGWLIFLIIVLPFYLYGYLNFGPQVFKEFIETDLSDRLFSEKDPFYYYFKALFLNFFPFFLLLLFKVKILKKSFTRF